MMKAVVVCDSVYGNTETVARAIAEGLGADGRVDAKVARVNEITPERIAEHDIIVLGSPNHFGGPTRAVRNIIRRLGESKLAGTRIAVFDTCFAPDLGKATRKMEERLSREVQGARILTPALSAIVVNMKGPLKEGELARSRDFGARVLAEASAG